MSDFSRVADRRPIYRLINSRWPTIGLFDKLADDEDDLRVLFNLEMMANPRNQPAAGRLSRIPAGEIVTGPTASFVMASFVHCHNEGGRFNDGSLGAWYGSVELETAIEETVHHLTYRLSMSAEGFPQTIQMRQLITKVTEKVLDLCGASEVRPELFDPNDHKPGQAFGAGVRWPQHEDGIPGLRFDSVRNPGGVNVCVYKPKALDMPIIQADHFQYDWDEDGNVTVAKLTKVKRPAI